MSKAFLPDYSTMSVNGRVRPLFKLYRDDRWHMVLDGKRPVECGSVAEAIRVAKDHVCGILNPRIRTERAADVLGVAEWRQKKTAAIQEERASLFAGFEGKSMFVRGREIAVERRRARA